VQGMTRTKTVSIRYCMPSRPIRANCSWHQGGSGSLSNPWRRTKDWPSTAGSRRSTPWRKS
jgi:hypothetical protein